MDSCLKERVADPSCVELKIWKTPPALKGTLVLGFSSSFDWLDRAVVLFLRTDTILYIPREERGQSSVTSWPTSPLPVFLRQKTRRRRMEVSPLKI